MRLFVFYVPNLRFSSATYNKVFLKEICKIYGGYAFDSKKMSSIKSKYQIIKMGNLYNGILDLDRNPSYIEEITKNEREYLIKQGDILITLTGTQNKQDYGYTVYIKEDMNSLLNQRCAFIKSYNINAKYLYYLLNTNRFKLQFFSSATGGTGNQANVSTKDIENFSMYVPLKPEQIIISSFLTKIDERINAQSKIIKDLRFLKKVLMEHILNSLDFEELSLKDFIEQSYARIIKASELKPFTGTKQYLSTSSIGEDGIEQIEQTITYDNRPSRASMLPIKNSIWFAKMKNSIKVYQSIGNDEHIYVLSTGFYGILCNEMKVNPTWIFETFKSDYFNNQKDRFSEGSSMSGIKDNQLSDIRIKLFLNKNEEKSCSELLGFLSKKIDVEIKLLEKYKEQKKFLLSNMFI